MGAAAAVAYGMYERERIQRGSKLSFSFLKMAAALGKICILHILSRSTFPLLKRIAKRERGRGRETEGKRERAKVEKQKVKRKVRVNQSALVRTYT